MTAETPVMWRVKYGMGNATGTASQGDWVYYEARDFKRMERDLFEAMLNGDAGDNRSAARTNTLSMLLRRRRKPELDAEGRSWRRYEVYEVAFLDGEVWVPVKVSWTPPKVVIEMPEREGETT